MGQGGGMSKLLAMVNLLWTGVIVIAYIGIMCQPDGWHHRWTLYYEVDVSLFSVHVKKGIAGAVMAAASNWLDKALGAFQREFTIQEFSEYMCTIQLPGTNTCAAGTQLKFASWTLVFCFILSIILHLFSIGFNWWYHYREAREVTRTWLWIFQILAPVVSVIGLMAYGIGTMELDRLPPIQSNTEGTHGHMFSIAIWVTAISFVPLLFTLCTGRTNDEIRNEGLAQLEEFNLKAQYKEYAGGYGATNASSSGQAQAYPPMNPGYQQQGAYQQPQQQQQQQQFYSGAVYEAAPPPQGGYNVTAVSMPQTQGYGSPIVIGSSSTYAGSGGGYGDYGGGSGGFGFGNVEVSIERVGGSGGYPGGLSVSQPPATPGQPDHYAEYSRNQHYDPRVEGYQGS